MRSPHWQGKRAREATSKDLRDSLQADTDRALKADRRNVYARFLATINKTMAASGLLGDAWTANQEDTARLVLHSAHTPTMTELYAAVAEVRLIAPAAIGDTAGVISDLFTDFFHELIDDDTPDFNTFYEEVTRHVKPLYAMMRGDLGVSANTPVPLTSRPSGTA